MNARRWARAIAIGGALYACTLPTIATIATPPSPALPAQRSPSITGTLAADPGKVWGVADLHAHPASHLAFGGLNGQAGLLWGDPALAGGRMAYVPGGDLPDIDSCDPQTHEANVSDEISRYTRGLVFQNLTAVTKYPHAPHGGPPLDSESPYESWPNGRDILHQWMNIQSIRRAFDGGLRLMLAATVEAQVIGFAMHTTIFPTAFTPSRELERASAEAQLQYIQMMANANADWMAIASTPEQAESAIHSGRLALIPAIENDGLLLSDIEDLVRTYGVGAIVPVHLVDNDVGGTAAYTDLFNSATALEGQMFGYPNRYISVEPDPTLTFHLGWPQTLQSVEVAFGIGQVQYSTASTLGYSQYPLCCPPGQGVPPNLGERNSVGLRQPQTLSALMAMGLLIDVAHMGFHSTADTIGVAQSTCNYPLVDTHTNFHTQGGDERNLYREHAAYVSSSHGVLGFGSSGSSLDALPIASARGGALASFGGGSPQPVVIQFPTKLLACTQSLACSPSASAASACDKIRLRVTTPGSLSGGDIMYAQITFGDNTQVNQPVTLNALTTPIALQHDVSDITSISINLLNQSSCSGGSSSLDVQSVQITDAAGNTLVTISPGDLGQQGSTPPNSLVTLTNGRSSFTAYSRCPAGPPAPDPAEGYLLPVTKANQPNEHLQIQFNSGTKGLRSASALVAGAKVTASLCPDAACNGINPCTNPQFSVTRAGGWAAGFELDQYYRIPREDTPPSYRAISICLTEPDLTQEPWEIDQVSVNVVVDPTRLWTGDYAMWLEKVFAGRTGAMALGTDINGLADQFPFADFSPAYANSQECGGPSVTETKYGDENSGGTFTLHRPLRIGTTALCFPDRGLATYGMLPEFFAAIYHYSPCVYRSVFSSAQATIDAWKASRTAAQRFATAPGSCAALDGGSPDAGPTTATLCPRSNDDGGSGDAAGDGGLADAGDYEATASPGSPCAN